MKRTILESSNNVHYTHSGVNVLFETEVMNTMAIYVPNGQMIVEHGHHHTVATEPDTRYVIKITQQEFNPITRAFNNAYD